MYIPRNEFLSNQYPWSLWTINIFCFKSFNCDIPLQTSSTISTEIIPFIHIQPSENVEMIIMVTSICFGFQSLQRAFILTFSLVLSVSWFGRYLSLPLCYLEALERLPDLLKVIQVLTQTAIFSYFATLLM